MKGALLVLLISQVGGVDGGSFEKPTIYRISKPTLVPEGYYYPNDTHEAVNSELQRLQWIEANPPKTSVEGFLIACVIGAIAGFVGGVAVGVVLNAQLGHK